jgi:hypothetical protein
VCEGAAGDEPTVRRAIADTSRRDLHVVSEGFHKCGNLSALWQGGTFIKFVTRQLSKTNAVNLRTVLLLVIE